MFVFYWFCNVLFVVLFINFFLSVSFIRPALMLSRPAPALSRPAPGFSRPAPALSRPAPGFSRPAITLSRPAPALSLPAPGFSRPAPGISRPLLHLPRPLLYLHRPLSRLPLPSLLKLAQVTPSHRPVQINSMKPIAGTTNHLFQPTKMKYSQCLRQILSACSSKGL